MPCYATMSTVEAVMDGFFDDHVDAAQLKVLAESITNGQHHTEQMLELMPPEKHEKLKKINADARARMLEEMSRLLKGYLDYLDEEDY